MSDGELTATLTQKGCDSIILSSEARESDITVAVGQVVNVKCRSECINPKLIQFHKNRKLSGEPEQHLQHTLRSEESNFSNKEKCICCGCTSIYNGKRPGDKPIPLRTSKDYKLLGQNTKGMLLKARPTPQVANGSSKDHSCMETS